MRSKPGYRACGTSPPFARSSASMRAISLGPFGGGGGGRNGGDPLGHPLGQGQVRAVGLAAERLAGDRVGAHPEQVEQVLLAHLRTRLDTAAVVEAAQASAQEHAGRGPRRCVVAGQVGGVTRGAVTGRDRLHQVAIARPQSHPA